MKQKSDPIFTYLNDDGFRAEISKPVLIALYQKIWTDAGNETNLTGHSFRVGGASLRWNNAVHIDDIIELGRWKSKAYQTYLRTYNKKQKDNTKFWWNRNLLNDVELAAVTPTVRNGVIEKVAKGKGKA